MRQWRPGILSVVIEKSELDWLGKNTCSWQSPAAERILQLFAKYLLVLDFGMAMKSPTRVAMDESLH